MQSAAQLWLFFLVVFAVIVLPGMDLAYVMSSALVGGRRHGLLAVAGIVAGGLCHVIAAALGLGLLLQLVPGLFNAVLLAGAAYLAWIGWSLLRSHSVAAPLATAAPATAANTWYRGAITSLLNPKAYVFMFAVFPQFLNPRSGAVWLQSLLLWSIIAITQILVYGTFALGVAGSRDWLTRRPTSTALLHRGVGVVLLVVALWTGVAGWRAA